MSTPVAGLPTPAAMRHGRFVMVNAGHARGSLTVWVTASAGWFDSRGMCDDLCRLDWADSSTCVWCSIFFKLGYGTNQTGRLSSGGFGTCDEFMFPCLGQAEQPWGQSVSLPSYFTLWQVGQMKESLGSFYGEECGERWGGLWRLDAPGLHPHHWVLN